MPSIIIGLLALSLGLWGLSVWWYSVVELLRGLVPLILVLTGMLALMAGVTRIRTEKHDVNDEELMQQFEEKTAVKDDESAL